MKNLAHALKVEKFQTSWYLCPKLLSFQIEFGNANFVFGNPNIFWKCNVKLGMLIIVWEIQFQIGNSNWFLEIQLKLGMSNFKFWKCFQFYFGNISNFNLEIFAAPPPSPDRVKFWKYFQLKIVFLLEFLPQCTFT